MAKISLVLILFAWFQAILPTYGMNLETNACATKAEFEYCDAPAPTNFVVSSMTSDLVSLNWDPAIANATHTLELFIEENGNWQSLWINPLVPDNFIILNNLEPGSYLARISTNCSSGETGEEFTEVPFRFKILDLTTLGRMPKNPTVVEDCQNIDYLNHKWVGFRVAEIETGLANYFEFIWENGSDPAIRRVFSNHPLVAVNKDGNYPLAPGEIFQAQSPFAINHLDFSGDGEVIAVGGVNCINSSMNHLELCKNELSNPTPWKVEYQFEALVADEILLEYPGTYSPAKENSLNGNLDPINWYVTNPFSSILEINIPNLPDQSTVIVRLYDINGFHRFSFSTNGNLGKYYIPTHTILPGEYILTIISESEIKTFKVVKI